MEYEGKSPGMNKFLNELFPHEENECPTCKGPIGPFRDSLSEREYRISHMCMSCQDEVFGSEETVPPDFGFDDGEEEYGLDGTDAYDRYKDHQLEIGYDDNFYQEEV